VKKASQEVGGEKLITEQLVLQLYQRKAEEITEQARHSPG
jgi:hypothetical protein